VRIPLKEVDASYKSLLSLALSRTETEISIQIGDQGFSISRVKRQTDFEDDGENDLDEADEQES